MEGVATNPPYALGQMEGVATNQLACMAGGPYNRATRRRRKTAFRVWLCFLIFRPLVDGN